MKQNLRAWLLIAFLSSILYGCGPAENNSFAGIWTANIGNVSFTQNETEVVGVIEGYGGFWHETFSGTISENGEAVFDTEVLGAFTLYLDGDMFKSKSSEISFCGIRSEVTNELPSDCGFSGKWIVPSKSVYLPGSYMILKQVGDQVTGDLYDGNDSVYDSFAGTVSWGKGWRANGTTQERGELTLGINSAETGFEFLSGSQPNRQQLCAVREGQTSAYLGSYTCTP